MAKTLGQLNVGDKIQVPIKEAYHSRFGANIVFTIADKNHAGYPVNSVTLITDKVIQMMAFDAREPGNPISGYASYGNNNYSLSNIRRWLISEASSSWYYKAHAYDAPPDENMANWSGGNNPYHDWPGFLYVFEDGFADRLILTEVSTKDPPMTGTYTNVGYYKMFLMSTTEGGLSSPYVAEGEGTPLALFATTPARRGTKTNECRLNSPGGTTTWDADYWFRTASLSTDPGRSYVIGTYGSGAGSSWTNTNSMGIRPVCNAPSSIVVSDTPNTEGVYTATFNSPPTTPATITAPSTVYPDTNIVVSCSVSTDAEGDKIFYLFEREINNSGAYTLVQRSESRTFTDTGRTVGETLRYRVSAQDALLARSGYTISNPISVIENTPPVISGDDADLGTKTGAFTHTYTVTDTAGDTISVTEK